MTARRARSTFAALTLVLLSLTAVTEAHAAPTYVQWCEHRDDFGPDGRWYDYRGLDERGRHVGRHNVHRHNVSVQVLSMMRGKLIQVATVTPACGRHTFRW